MAHLRFGMHLVRLGRIIFLQFVVDMVVVELGLFHLSHANVQEQVTSLITRFFRKHTI